MTELRIISDSEYKENMEKCSEHLEMLQLIVECTNSIPEGGSYYKDQSLVVRTDDASINLRKNLMSVARECKKIIEIGFNMGHSALFMLISNPNCKIVCIDDHAHSYTEYCFDYLSYKFPGRLEMLKGKSHDMLNKGGCKITQKNELADCVHIDGCHDYLVANIDFFISYNKVKINGYIIFDDIWLEHLSSLWQGYIRDKLIIPVDCLNCIGEGIGHGIGKITLPKLRICVCSFAFGDEYKRMTKYGRITKINYCKKYGYDFREDEDIYDKSRPPAWSKVNLIQKCLLEGKYDYIVWIDADTHIMNSEKRLEEFIFHYSNDRDIMLTLDITEKINSGVMFIKNTEWASFYFQCLYNQIEFIDHPNWEQEAIIHLYNNDILSCKDYMTVLPSSKQKLFNSYFSNYSPGDFIVHLAGCYRNNVNNGLDEMMNVFCPLKMDHETEEEFEGRMRLIESGLVRV